MCIRDSSYTINSLNLLDKTYSIGDIYIERVANGDELELYYNIGFTESMDKYYVQLINESGNIIDSLKLKNADYIDKVYYFINGKRVKAVSYTHLFILSQSFIFFLCLFNIIFISIYKYHFW